MKSWKSSPPVERDRLSQLSLLRQYPSISEWLKLKAALSVDLLADWRNLLTEAGGADKELSANAFMPPFNLLTGFDFAAAAASCTSISPKLYTMHWTVMVQFWRTTLLEQSPGLDERLLVRALTNLFDLGDEIDQTLADYHYPEPDEPHPVSDAVQRRKIRQAVAETAGRTAVTPIVHGYGPQKDFVRRFRVAAESGVDGVWINRYGYLSDAKLSAVGAIWRELHG